MKKKVLVTGAGGYIGRFVVKSLLEQGQEVVAADFYTDNIDSRATVITKDIFNDFENIYKDLQSPDICIHLAWKDGFVHNSNAHMQFLSSHFKFITSMIDQGLKHIAIMGTMHEIGYYEGEINECTPCNPLSQYGIAKNALRQSILNYIENKEIVLQWLRAYYIYGDDLKNNSIFTKLTQAENEGKDTFPFTTGLNKYDFISVEQLALQIAKAAIQDKVTGIINCCSGKPVELRRIIEDYIEENNFKINLDYGKFPDRPYDSPIVYGNANKINTILKDKENVNR
jgi:dTDP-6-deoxy-L-talose 4-dehydrogenase (NAD+)